MDEIIVELKAAIAYLRIMGAVYPIRPGKTIATIERAMMALKDKEDKEDNENIHRS